MPNIGAPELIVILIIALVVIGPGRLPDVGAALGKSIREFRKASSDMAEATRIDTTTAPPAAAAAPPPAAAAAPAPQTPVATPTAPPVPAPLAAPPEPAADETADRTS